MQRKNSITTLNLCISIFYNINEWHKISTEGIFPFLNQTKHIISYLILMHRKRGDNIRLVLKVEEKHSMDVANLCDSYFRNYLITAPSNSYLTENNKLFQDFNNNTVQYGIFKFYDSTMLLNSNDYNVDVSNLLNDMFKTEKDKVAETTFELLIRMLLIYFNVVAANNSEIIRLLKKSLDENKQNYGLEIFEKNTAKAQIIFRENKNEFVDFSRGYLSSSFKEYEYEWEKKWFNIVKKNHQKIPELLSDADKNIFFESLFLVVYQMFNIKKNSDIILNVLLKTIKTI